MQQIGSDFQMMAPKIINKVKMDEPSTNYIIWNESKSWDEQGQ